MQRYCLLLVCLYLALVSFAQQEKISTASPRVHIIDTAFTIPQLNRTRRIWIYVPEGQKDQRYPVLYMQDGQNLFDASTSYAGEWGLDEFMDSTHQPPCIVVGIDNGGVNRIHELTPYDMEKYGKAEGGAYLDFIVKTLKPYIDKHYPVRKKRGDTWIGGSSLGGLISFYALLKYPRVFGGAAVFSPSFWIAPRIYEETKGKMKKIKAALYFYAGKQESEKMVQDMMKMMQYVSRSKKIKAITSIRDEGKHNEASWRKEFPFFYAWMMENHH
jgi:predicted alpha/beta superfamily hydrolase